VLLRGLPSHSHYVSAYRDDPEVAEWVAAQPERARWSPPPQEWDLGTELQAAIFDRIGQLITAVVNTSGRVAKPVPAPPRFSRPVTAIEKAKARAEARIELELDSLIRAAHETYAAEHGKEGRDAHSR